MLIKTCQEYDAWKESNRSNIEKDFISDKAYLEERAQYFQSWKCRILENKFLDNHEVFSEEMANLHMKWILLPPYSLEEVEEFEKLNKIYLPIQLKYYITQISRVFAKRSPEVFRIYDVDYYNDIYEEDFELIIDDKKDIRDKSIEMHHRFL